MRMAFIETLCQLAEQDGRIWLLTGDLGYSLLERFVNRFPDRFVNVGVAEQNLIGIATGLALCGRIVFVYSIANFPTLRCLEQIRNDVCYHNSNVKIVAVGGGLGYGPLGYTHHGVEDLAIMQALPNMAVIAPGDLVEARLTTKAVANWQGPCYLRLGRASGSIVHQTPPDFEIAKALKIREGKDLTLISSGEILKTVVDAASALLEKGIDVCVLSMPTIKPLDTQAVIRAGTETQKIVTIEEHSIQGGLGVAVGMTLLDYGMEEVRLLRLGLATAICKEIGSQNYLRAQQGLSTNNLLVRIERFYDEKKSPSS